MSDMFLKDDPQFRDSEVGDFSYYNGKIRVKFWGGKLKIGKFTSIGDGTVIILGGEHNPANVTMSTMERWFPDVVKVAHGRSHSPVIGNDVIIGSDVWICTDALIRGGVVIGDGAVIGARAVVVTDVEPYSIVGGVPAKHIRYRFNEQQRRKLLEIKWWNWPIERVKKYAPLLQSENIEEFLRACGAT